MKAHLSPIERNDLLLFKERSNPQFSMERDPMLTLDQRPTKPIDQEPDTPTIAVQEKPASQASKNSFSTRTDPKEGLKAFPCYSV